MAVDLRAEPSAHDRPLRRAWCLIVCIDHYADHRLTRNDIHQPTLDRLNKILADPKRYPAIADRLIVLRSQPGTEPDRLATATQIRSSFTKIANEALPTDDLFVIWLTRFMPAEGETRWLAMDADENHLAATGLLTGEIDEFLQTIRCRHRVIVVDPLPAPADWGQGSTPSAVRSATSPLAEWVGPNRLVVGVQDGQYSLKDQGAFASRHFFNKLTDAMGGAADRAGGEPDGWISTTEVIDYLKKESPSSLALGTDPARWLGRNPSNRIKLDQRRAALVARHDRQEIDENTLALGLRLIDRVPRFSEEQQLRRAYFLFIDGKISAGELSTKRRQFLNQKQMDDLTCLDFARRVAEAYREIRRRHVHPDDAPAALQEGCYDLAEAFGEIDETWITPAIDEIVSAAPTGEEPQTNFIAILARLRARLGKRAEVTLPAENILLDGLLRSLDPYSTYLPPNSFQQIQQQSRGRFTGIGAVLEEKPREGILRVLMPIPGGPAAQAGLQEGDLIVAVDGTTTRELGPTEASRRLLGETNSPVSIELTRPPSNQQSLTLTRQDVPLETVVGYDRSPDHTWNYWLPLPKSSTRATPFRPAYVRITRFAGDTADRLHRVLKDLESEGMTHLLLDLRFNPGGLMESAVDVADLFISDGLIVRVRDRQGIEKDRSAVPLGTFVDLQLLVLINGESASGSEIVAAAIQDAGRGIIVGSRSFGKGSVQEIVALPDSLRGLKITSAIFLRPAGENLERFLEGRRPASQRWGVSPNLGWEMPLYREEIERLRNSLVRRQYVGADVDSLRRDPVLRRVLDRLEASSQSDSPQVPPSAGSK
jgi:carboxyl-terminal processing protease